jgi:virginiamycin B lyase
MGQFLASICAHPSGIAVGPDHNLYINLVDLTSFPLVPSTVAVLSKTGTPLARIDLPDASTPQSIATGPDGNLWITLAGTNEIARMTTSGTLTFYPVPTANAFPPWGIDNAASAQIISGTDNDLWFVEGGANAIGRITTSGTLTEYAIPTAASAPLGISLCRPVIPKHECVWFTESAAGKIGELTL